MSAASGGRLDARWFQILFLSSFLVFGALARDFALTPLQVVLTFASGIATQVGWQRLLRMPARGLAPLLLSPLVSCFGICILVRADNLWAHPLLAFAAMSSKYVIRLGPESCKSHVLNPANFAAVAALSWLHGTWLSPGQWGADSLIALWFLALGGLVTYRIQRSDVSLAFLGTWAMLLAARLIHLGYAWNPGAAMWLQQCSNGAVLLFAFFMISDPMTTPQQRPARIAYAMAVALFAFVWQFQLFRSNGLIMALFFMSWTVPIWNFIWPKERFAWRHSAAPDSVGSVPAT